jgi:superoxide dismutase
MFFWFQHHSGIIRVIRKVMKTRHQNAEFVHTRVEIFKNLQKKNTLTFNEGETKNKHQIWW